MEQQLAPCEVTLVEDLQAHLARVRVRVRLRLRLRVRAWVTLVLQAHLHS